MAGSSRSGLAVARTMESRSWGVRPASWSAFLLASATQHGDGLVGAGDMPLSDAGALDDPFVGRIEHPGEVGIGQHAGRNGDSDAERSRRTVGGSCRRRGFALGELRADVAAQIDLHRLDGHPNCVLDGIGRR